MCVRPLCSWALRTSDSGGDTMPGRQVAARGLTVTFASCDCAGHVFYGQSEWERICGAADADEEQRLLRFRTSAALSSALVKQCNVLFDFEPFPVRVVMEGNLRRAERIDGCVTMLTSWYDCSYCGRRSIRWRRRWYSSSNWTRATPCRTSACVQRGR